MLTSSAQPILPSASTVGMPFMSFQSGSMMLEGRRPSRFVATRFLARSCRLARAPTASRPSTLSALIPVVALGHRRRGSHRGRQRDRDGEGQEHSKLLSHVVVTSRAGRDQQPSRPLGCARVGVHDERLAYMEVTNRHDLVFSSGHAPQRRQIRRNGRRSRRTTLGRIGPSRRIVPYGSSQMGSRRAHRISDMSDLPLWSDGPIRRRSDGILFPPERRRWGTDTASR